jgi:hypothetical protein
MNIQPDRLAGRITMTALKCRALGGIPPNSITCTQTHDVRTRPIGRPQQFKRLETLRPLTSWLCPGDFICFSINDQPPQTSFLSLNLTKPQSHDWQYQ